MAESSRAVSAPSVGAASDGKPAGRWLGAWPLPAAERRTVPFPAAVLEVFPLEGTVVSPREEAPVTLAVTSRCCLS